MKGPFESSKCWVRGCHDPSAYDWYAMSFGLLGRALTLCHWHSRRQVAACLLGHPRNYVGRWWVKRHDGEDLVKCTEVDDVDGFDWDYMATYEFGIEVMGAGGEARKELLRGILREKVK